jgi:hypothetical protein
MLMLENYPFFHFSLLLRLFQSPLPPCLLKLPNKTLVITSIIRAQTLFFFFFFKTVDTA